MATRRINHKDESVPAPKRRRTASTPEGRENQMINLAFELSERQLREGTASSQVITHYLKLGSSREKLEQERIRLEGTLLEAKVQAMESQKRVEELYGKALNAMRSYAGQEPLSDDQDFDD